MSKQSSLEEVIQLLKFVKMKLARLEQHYHKQMVTDGALWNEEARSSSTKVLSVVVIKQ